MHPFNVPLREVQPMAAVGSTPTEGNQESASSCDITGSGLYLPIPFPVKRKVLFLKDSVGCIKVYTLSIRGNGVMQGPSTDLSYPMSTPKMLNAEISLLDYQQEIKRD